MSKTQQSRAIPLSATALVVSIAFTVAFVMGPYRSEATIAILVVGSVIAPTLIVAAALSLLRPVLRGTAVARAALLCTTGLGFVFGALAGAAWSVGFDEADAGRALSLFATLSIPFALVALALLLIALATAGYLIGPRPAAPLLRALGSTGAAIPVAITALVGGLTPIMQPLVATAVLVLAVVLPRADERAGAAPSPSTPSEPPHRSEHRSEEPWHQHEHQHQHAHAHEHAHEHRHEHERRAVARQRATTLAVASLASTVAIWGGALLASVGFAGQPEATTVLGAAGGAAQLAAIPLLWCATILLTTRQATWNRALRAAAAASSVLVAAVGVALTLGANPDGVLFFSLLPVLAVAAMIWTGTVAWLMLEKSGQRMSRGSRIATALALALGAGFAYVAVIGMTMGIGLAPASGLLAFWGVRAALGPDQKPHPDPGEAPDQGSASASVPDRRPDRGPDPAPDPDPDPDASPAPLPA
ncbi:hypothetical protein B0I08_10364 [Glaciihabitans tibetensis]|uniref:Uncharacterized protein n=1 Tax=Glaciihabitans tibetensis TaxID=1266600 RepID=A0A2T0VF84_9MICO|nr:hypothetical protein [Glaciihabitans tibetensis]PRY68859.1 hypothetical protein B0I08_10364 [Glaciihabitans tibetensis]